MAPDVSLKRTYSVLGGDLATPVREFRDGSGIAWYESIFVNGHGETLERQTKEAFRALVLQEVRR